MYLERQPWETRDLDASLIPSEKARYTPSISEESGGGKQWDMYLERQPWETRDVDASLIPSEKARYTPLISEESEEGKQLKCFLSFFPNEGQSALGKFHLLAGKDGIGMRRGAPLMRRSQCWEQGN